MAASYRPLSLRIACALILAALVLVSGRTVYDLCDMSRTRDEVVMSGVWADAVWCNVAVWIALGLPLIGTMLGWKYGRLIVAALSAALIVLLAVLMRSGNHTLNPWMLGIVALQIIGTALFFVPPSNAYFRAQPAAAERQKR